MAVAESMKELFVGKSLCADNPADWFWLDVLSEAAGIEPHFTVLPLESFVGREAAAILRHLPVRKGHRAGADVVALKLVVDGFW
ncbi:hypothetical protein AC519_2582 [Pseudomonas savastanoi]|nr:hypothetical protein AC519_2582 [Pseudomonas savastanoi]